MDAILLIADNDEPRRVELRRFFRDSGFLVMAVANGLECVAALAVLEPDVLVIELEIPWGGGEGVIARLNGGLLLGRRPLILVLGDGPAKVLSERTGVAPSNCFSKSFLKEDLLDRIGMDRAAKPPCGAEARQRPPETTLRPRLIEGGIR